MSEKLLNGLQLATALGVPRGFVTAMRHYPKQPFDFRYGNRTTETEARQWLLNNPDFKWTEYIERSRKVPKKRPQKPAWKRALAILAR